MPVSGRDISRSSGTQAVGFSSGCRACTRRMRLSPVISTGRASISALNFALANNASKSVITRMDLRSAGSSPATRSLRVQRTRRSSVSISTKSPSSVWRKACAAVGSMNTVLPLADASTARPGNAL